jgi:putative FmdB family regulatory protein
MPIYEYECSLCHHTFERKQRFDEEPIAICPTCSGKSRRVINSVPIIFKGSGFYVTDHRTSSNPSNGGNTTTDKK